MEDELHLPTDKLRRETGRPGPQIIQLESPPALGTLPDQGRQRFFRQIEQVARRRLEDAERVEQDARLEAGDLHRNRIGGGGEGKASKLPAVVITEDDIGGAADRHLGFGQAQGGSNGGIKLPKVAVGGHGVGRGRYPVDHCDFRRGQEPAIDAHFIHLAQIEVISYPAHVLAEQQIAAGLGPEYAEVGGSHVGSVVIQVGDTGVGVVSQRDVLIDVALNQARRGGDDMGDVVGIYYVRIQSTPAGDN